jgi:hypothetical protein
MKTKNFTKEKVSLIALFLMLITATAVMMTACKSTINPTSAGVATITVTPTATATITNTPIPANPSLTPLAAGSIAFTGWGRNGDDQIAFVPLVALTQGTTIYFTNLAWDSTHTQFSDQSVVNTSATFNNGYAGSGPPPAGAVTENEEVISYVVPGGGLGVGTPVVIGTGSALVQSGTVANVAVFANTSPSGIALTTSTSNTKAVAAASVTYLDSGKSNAGHMFAYTVPSGTVPSAANNYLPTGSVFTTGLIFGPDAFTAGVPAYYFDSALPSGLTLGTNAIDLSALYENIYTVYPTLYNSAVASSGNNISCFVNGTVCPTTAAGINTGTGGPWVGTIEGASKLIFSATTTGVTVCSSGTGYAFVPATNMGTPVPY